MPDLNFKEAIKKPIAIKRIQNHKPFRDETPESKMQGKKGDWRMGGVNGEMYPCDKGIFNKTYNLLK